MYSAVLVRIIERNQTNYSHAYTEHNKQVGFPANTIIDGEKFMKIYKTTQTTQINHQNFQQNSVIVWQVN